MPIYIPPISLFRLTYFHRSFAGWCSPRSKWCFPFSTRQPGLLLTTSESLSVWRQSVEELSAHCADGWERRKQIEQSQRGFRGRRAERRKKWSSWFIMLILLFVYVRASNCEFLISGKIPSRLTRSRSRTFNYFFFGTAFVRPGGEKLAAIMSRAPLSARANDKRLRCKLCLVFPAPDDNVRRTKVWALAKACFLIHFRPFSELLLTFHSRDDSHTRHNMRATNFLETFPSFGRSCDGPSMGWPQITLNCFWLRISTLSRLMCGGVVI